MSEPEATNSGEPQGGLAPPQFRLVTLLLLIGLVCAILAATRFMGPYATFLLVLLVLAIAAHVAGNKMGTQLRDLAGRRSREEQPDGRPTSSPPSAPSFAPATRLRDRVALGKPIYYIAAAGSLLAAVGGGFWLAYALKADATWANMTLGIFAFGVLGAIWSFVAGSFVQVLIGAAWQAARSDKQNAPPFDDR